MRALELAVIAAVATAAILALLLRTGLAWRLAIDAPNQRSLHRRPTPRIGGIAMTPVVLLVSTAAGALPMPVLAGAAALAAVSLIDDYRSLPPGLRFAIQFGCAAAATAGTESTPLWALVIAVMALVWITNLFNFMDGSDGLAGGMALIGFGACGLGAADGGDMALAAACAAIAGAAVGFLAFNWPPARVFLGDVGSIPTGFLAGAIGWLGWLAGDWPWWFAPLAFSPFIADATLTLLARAARRERVWLAHREHTYQRMVTHGFGHRGTALWWYLLMAVASGCALLLRDAPRTVVVAGLIAWMVFYPLAFWLGKRAWPLKAAI